MLLSRDSIIMILDALEVARERVIKEGKREIPTDCDGQDLVAYLNQIDNAFDELEIVYNQLRTERTDLAPFSEIARHQR